MSMVGKMTIPDWYQFLNYKIIDTSSEVMSEYNWIYIPFNAIESMIWFFCSIRVWMKYRKNMDFPAKFIYSMAFLLFSLSDIIELSATTPLLLLFKGSIILILVVCYKSIKVKTDGK